MEGEAAISLRVKKNKNSFLSQDKRVNTKILHFAHGGHQDTNPHRLNHQRQASRQKHLLYGSSQGGYNYDGSLSAIRSPDDANSQWDSNSYMHRVNASQAIQPGKLSRSLQVHLRRDNQSLMSRSALSPESVQSRPIDYKYDQNSKVRI